MYLDTANLKHIKKAVELGIFKGVTTNPTILAKEGRKREEIAIEILDIIDGELYLQLVGDTVDDFIKEYEDIIRIGNSRIGIKIPANFEGIKAIKKIRNTNKDIKILGTAIFTVDQALLCALAGCDLVAPYVNRMENNNIPAMDVISKIRKIYDMKGLKTEILAASFKNTSQIINAYANGAHLTTVPFDMIAAMTTNKLAHDSIEKFNQDWRKLNESL